MSRSIRPQRNFPGIIFLLPGILVIIALVGLALWLPSRSSSKSTLTPEQQKWVDTSLAGLTVNQKIGQMIITGVLGAEIRPRTCEQLVEIYPGGITFQSENVRDPDQLRALIQELRACAAQAELPPLFFTLAHEGEYVNHFEGVATQFPAALSIGAAGSEQLAYQVALATGQELAYSGLNMVLAPVADVLTDYNNEVINMRTYGGDPQKAGRFVEASVKGFLDAGIIPVLKHFPGHGSVSADSHLVLPVDHSDMNTLRATHLPPFAQGLQAGAPVVMLSHVAFPEASGSELPASLSAWSRDILESELNFNGLIMSDSLRMKGVRSGDLSVEQVSLMAINAGVDVLLLNHPGQARSTFKFLQDAVSQGQLSEARLDEAVRRILTVKAAWEFVERQGQPAAEPDWQAHQQLARQVAAQAVSVYQDRTNLVPIPAGTQKVLVIGPDSSWPFYQDVLASALQQRGFAADFIYYPAPWDGIITDMELLRSLPESAKAYDLALVFTWQSHLLSLGDHDAWQVKLVNRLQKAGLDFIVIALKSPTDLIDFADVPAYIATYGTTPGALDGLVDVLLNDRPQTSSFPLPNLKP